MPSTNIQRHTPAIAAEYDAREFSTKQIMRVEGASNVDVPLQTITEPHWDALALLHGYGTRTGQTLASVFNLAWATAGNNGTLQVSIDDTTDLFKISIAGGDNIILESDSGSEDHALYGFPAAGLTSAVTLTATGPWQRGVFMPVNGIRVTQDRVGGATVTLPTVDYRMRKQSLPVWIRQRGSMGDLDDVFLTVEDAVEAQCAAAGTPFLSLISMLIEADGHTSIDILSTDNISLKNTNDAARFWRTFGFDFTETFIAHGNRKYLKSANRAESLLVSEYGYLEFRRSTEFRDQHIIMANGGVVSSGLAPIQGYELALRIKGPAHGPDQTLEKHLRQFMLRLRRRLTFFPMWGDQDRETGSIETRRHRDLDNAVGNIAKYNTYYTTEADLAVNNYARVKGGRLLFRLHPSSMNRYKESYSGQAIDAFLDVSFKLLDDVDRPLVADDIVGV